MKPEQAFADAELSYEDKSVRLKAFVDTGASKSVISKRLAEELKAFAPLKEAYELRTADKGERLKIIGYCRVDIVFQGLRHLAERYSKSLRT